MVDEEHLAALDFMLWMSGSHRASSLAHTNQSTVIRRANIVLGIFGAVIQRSSQGWLNLGETELLRMERAIHQQFRFRGRGPLRLHTPFWSIHTVWDKLPQSWITNPPDLSYTCENPLQLLRERVIDACILTPTQIELHSSDLHSTLLYHSQIDLTLFLSPDSEHGLHACSLEEQMEMGAPPDLKLFRFLPESCRVISRQWFSRKFSSGQDPAASAPGPRPSQHQVAFLTPEMRGTLTSSFLVDSSSPHPYRETLVVLRENAQQPRFLELVEALVPHFSDPATALPVLRNQRKTQHNSRSAQA